MHSFPDVIHTVGPQGENPEKLESCYRSCLRVLTKNQLRSVVRYLDSLSGSYMITLVLLKMYIVTDFIEYDFQNTCLLTLYKHSYISVMPRNIAGNPFLRVLSVL